MSFLFYLNKQNNKIGLRNFEKFIDYVRISIQNRIVILCESEFDKIGLDSLFFGKNITKIIHVYDFDEQSANNLEQITESFQLNQLKLVEPSRFNEEINTIDLVLKLENQFSNIIEKYNVKKVHFGIQEIFRSIGFIILQQLLKKKHPILHGF